jgi:hypothetical protein
MSKITALAVQMTHDDKKRVLTKNTDNLEAYDAYLKANEIYNTTDPEELTQCRLQLQKAIRLDPLFAKAYAAMGKTFFKQWIFRPDKDPAILNSEKGWL